MTNPKDVSNSTSEEISIVKENLPSSTAVTYEHDEGKDTQGYDGHNVDDETTKEDEIEEDEEGLNKKGYDVIIYGTGLTQSILASALSRAGKTILHCDGNDFYGEKDAVFSLGSLMEWTKAKRDDSECENENTSFSHVHEHDSDNDSFSSISLNSGGTISSIKILSQTDIGSGYYLQDDMDVITPYGQGIVKSLSSNAKARKMEYSSLAIQLKHWKLANGKSPIAYFGYHPHDHHNDSEDEPSRRTILSKYYAQNYDIMPLKQYQLQRYVLSQKRSFALDLTPGLLYANGEEVTGLVNSGVSEYCEFKSLLGLYLFMKNDTRKISVKNSPNATDDDNGSFQLSRVPCSKRDVFQTKLLSPVEKRKLMKFLQIATDYAFAKASGAGDAGSEKNSRFTSTSSTDTDQTRKSSDSKSTTVVEEDLVTSLNERQLQQGRSLYRPQNKSVSTSDLERLQQCIHDKIDFITYLESEQKLTPRLRDIIIYAMSLASNTEAADEDSTHSYSTMDGMNDLSSHLQSLGRYGGTAFLVPLYGAGELCQAFCRSAAVHGGTYLLRRALTKVLVDGKGDSNGVCSVLLESGPSLEDDASSPTKLKEIPTRNVIIPQDAIRSSTPSRQTILRRISILRGKLLLDNTSTSPSEQRHIIIIPPNTIGNQNVIYGITLDESANVAPYYHEGGFETTVLHLTTMIDKINAPSDGEDLLQLAVHSLVEKSQNDRSESNIEEIYHLSFSYNLMLPTEKVQKAGLHICNKFGPSVTLKSAFSEASSIFKKICPGSTFLKLSEAMDERVKESRLGLTDEDNDIEKAVLESAMDIVISTVVSDHN